MISSENLNLRPVPLVQKDWRNVADAWYWHMQPVGEQDFFDVIPFLELQKLIKPHIPQLGKKGRILDIASGANPFDYLPSELAPHIVAIDITKEMAVRNESGSKIVADARQRWPFADSSFPLVTSFLGMSYLENSVHVLSEFARVTSPGGTIIVVDFHRKNRTKKVVHTFDVAHATHILQEHGIQMKTTEIMFYPERIDVYIGEKLIEPQAVYQSR